MKRSQDKNQSTEPSETFDSFHPVIKQVEQKHLGLSCLENAVTELLDLQTSLERQLKLTSFNDDVGEV